MTDYIRKLARNHDLQDRIGSGYSGTLKNFCNNGPLLKSMCYRPVMLILRDDNLPAVISAMRKSGWDVIVGEDLLDFIRKARGLRIHECLEQSRKIFFGRQSEGVPPGGLFHPASGQPAPTFCP
jgi:hypothetical protein